MNESVSHLYLLFAAIFAMWRMQSRSLQSPMEARNVDVDSP